MVSRFSREKNDDLACPESEEESEAWADPGCISADDKSDGSDNNSSPSGAYSGLSTVIEPVGAYSSLPTSVDPSPTKSRGRKKSAEKKKRRRSTTDRPRSAEKNDVSGNPGQRRYKSFGNSCCGHYGD